MYLPVCLMAIVRRYGGTRVHVYTRTRRRRAARRDRDRKRTAEMWSLVLAALPIGGVAGFENMNGEYVISKTPGASDAKFNTKWSECERPHLSSGAAPPRASFDQRDHAELT